MVLGVLKKLFFGIFSNIKTTLDKKNFIVEIIDVLSLSKFWRYLVDVKIVKTKYSIGYNSYMNQNMKNVFL